MSTIAIAVLIITTTIGLPILFILISKRNLRKKNKKELNFFLLAGNRNGLFFSRQEILENKILGLDEENKTLLVYDFENEENVILINMIKVRNCSVVRNHEQVNMGDEKKARMEQRLLSIDLTFVFKNGGDEPVSVSFYDSRVNSIYEMTDLEARAKVWETVLSKIGSKKFEVTAQVPQLKL